VGCGPGVPKHPSRNGRRADTVPHLTGLSARAGSSRAAFLRKPLGASGQRPCSARSKAPGAGGGSRAKWAHTARRDCASRPRTKTEGGQSRNQRPAGPGGGRPESDFQALWISRPAESEPDEVIAGKLNWSWRCGYVDVGGAIRSIRSRRPARSSTRFNLPGPGRAEVTFLSPAPAVLLPARTGMAWTAGESLRRPPPWSGGEWKERDPLRCASARQAVEALTC